MVGQEDERVARGGIVHMDAAQGAGKLDPPGEFAGQDDGLITAQAGGLVHRSGGPDTKVQANLGPDDQVDASVVELGQPGKIQVTAIQNIKSAGHSGTCVNRRTSEQVTSVTTHQAGRLPRRFSSVCNFTAAKFCCQ